MLVQFFYQNEVVRLDSLGVQIKLVLDHALHLPLAPDVRVRLLFGRGRVVALFGQLR